MGAIGCGPLWAVKGSHISGDGSTLSRQIGQLLLNAHTHLHAVVVKEILKLSDIAAAMAHRCWEERGPKPLSQKTLHWGRPGDSVASVVALSQSSGSLGVWLL